MNQRLLITATLLAGACAVASGCKSKDSGAKGAGGTATPGTGSAPPVAPPAASPDAAPAPPPPAPAAITVTAGQEPPRGCFAWAAKAHAAACVVGEVTNGEAALKVAFVGGTGEELALGATLDEATATKLTAALATDGYAAPTGAAIALEVDKPMTSGAATLTLTSKTTAKGGDNVAPTAAIKLTAVCNGKDVALYDQALEGGTPAVTVRALADRLLIEVSIKVAREGEQSETLGAAVLDPATCAAAVANL